MSDGLPLLASIPEPHVPAHANLLIPLLILIAAAAAGGLMTWLLGKIVPPLRRRLRIRRARKRSLSAAATTELRTRALMDELCPDGWQADLVLFSSAEALPPEAPDQDRTRVLLEWSELHGAAVVRRVWAPDVNQALEAMVAERITEDTLLRIEQQALADGADWQDY